MEVHGYLGTGRGCGTAQIPPERQEAPSKQTEQSKVSVVKMTALVVYSTSMQIKCSAPAPIFPCDGHFAVGVN